MDPVTGAIAAFVLVGSVGLASGQALASDGVIEINQVRALAGGITASDTPGFPVTLDRRGSYVLTSDLDLTGTPSSPNTTGIRVSADDVTIDLNGFGIYGPATCTGEPVTSCTGGGSGSGIDTYTDIANNVTIKNGTIRGVGFIGISGRERIHVVDVRVTECVGGGVWILEQGTLTRVRADHNGYDGIFSGDWSNVQASTAHANLNDGIFADIGSTLIGNTSTVNGGVGIRVQDQGTVVSNMTRSNSQGGILVGDGSTVNDNTAASNGDDGIETGIGSTVKGNTAFRNGMYGLNLGANTGFVDNTMNMNFGGALSGAGIQLGSNLCDVVLCP